MAGQTKTLSLYRKTTSDPPVPEIELVTSSQSRQKERRSNQEQLFLTCLTMLMIAAFSKSFVGAVHIVPAKSYTIGRCFPEDNLLRTHFITAIWFNKKNRLCLFRQLV